MSSTSERYMRARMFLNSAISEFIEASYSAGFGNASIASGIIDSIYDTDQEIFKEVQHATLPMVKRFHHSKSLHFEQLEADWKKAVVEWEQREMWKIMGRK